MMVSKDKKRHRISKAKFSKIVISLMLISVLLFTIAMIWLFTQFGAVPDTLIIAYYGFVGGEAGILGFIKVNDTKHSNPIVQQLPNEHE